MTYWTILWYAGSVVVTLGTEGQSLNTCNMIGQLMMNDIVLAYSNPELEESLTASVFPTNQFSVTCETTPLPIDERYME